MRKTTIKFSRDIGRQAGVRTRDFQNTKQDCQPLYRDGGLWYFNEHFSVVRKKIQLNIYPGEGKGESKVVPVPN
jgi:hypothetical protein